MYLTYLLLVVDGLRKRQLLYLRGSLPICSWMSWRRAPPQRKNQVGSNRWELSVWGSFFKCWSDMGVCITCTDDLSIRDPRRLLWKIWMRQCLLYPWLFCISIKSPLFLFARVVRFNILKRSISRTDTYYSSSCWNVTASVYRKKRTSCTDRYMKLWSARFLTYSRLHRYS